MRRQCQSWLAVLLVAAWAGCGGTHEASQPGDAPRIREAASPARLSVPAARRLLAERPGTLILDVRNPEEWNDDLGHIEEARQIPLGELPDRVGELEPWKEQSILVVCRSGSRSQRAARLLAEAGYRQVFDLEGGMAAWRAEAGP